MDLSATLSSPPKAIKDVLSDSREIEAFKHWRSHAGNDLHPTFSKETEYDSQRAIWKAPVTQELELVLMSAQQLDPSFDLKGCTWNDMLLHINAAIESDEEKSKSSKIRRLVRNANAEVQMLNSLVAIIPDEKGLSFLRGGLSFIFKSWDQRLETRARIPVLLAEIINVFALVAAQRNLYKVDNVLRTLIFDLYGATLDAVLGLINILLRTHKGNFFQRARKQLPPNESQEVERISTHIENMSTRLTNRMSFLSSQRDDQTYKNTQAIKNEMQATRYHVSNVEADVQDISYSTHEIQQTADKIYAQGQDVHAQLNGVDASIRNASATIGSYVDASIARHFEQCKREFNSGLASLIELQRENNDLAAMIRTSVVQTSMYQFMGEKISAERLGWLPRPTLQPLPLRYRPIDITLEQITAMLNIDSTSILAETQRILRLTHYMQPEGLEKVRSILSTNQFRDWMGLPFPNALLIDGNCRNLGHGRTSPLSIFCASLATSLAALNSNIVLHFFCGHHSNPQYDSMSGPAGLLRSLITQLILYPNACMMAAVSVEQSMWSALTRYEVPALLSLFEQLVLLLHPSKSIYIIVDNVSDFQSLLHGFSQDTVQVLQYLHRLADERRPGPRMKLLMTSANRTVAVADIVDQTRGEYISPHTSSASRRGGPTRGRPFENDIRMIMQSSQDCTFLDPQTYSSRRSQDDEGERPRSVGRYM